MTMAQAPNREPFGMFYVMVDPNNPIEKILALATMAPYFLVCALTTLVVRCRELVTISWLVGHLMNEVANFVLKRLFKQARPPGALNVGFDGHGMPSAHSQFMGFFLSFGLCLVLFRVRCSIFLRFGAILGTALLSAIVCYSRIELGFHTEDQVVVGVMVGLALGSSWFFLCYNFLFPHFSSIAASPIGRILQLRDGKSIDNVLDFEYAAYRKHEEANKKKSS